MAAQMPRSGLQKLMKIEASQCLRNLAGTRRAASIGSTAGPGDTRSGQHIEIPTLNGDGAFPEKARFLVVGSPFSLVNASIPARSILYTRRGTLVGLSGDATNVRSTLSIFNTGIRATVSGMLRGAPFLYQKISATGSFTALLGTRATATSFAVLELDGRLDWKLVARNTLLAWCGVQATTGLQDMSFLRASTSLSGRGSAVISGNGQIYQIVLQQGESYIMHPSNVLAYSDSCPQPQQVRIQNLKLSIPVKLPSLSNFVLQYEFFRVMSRQPFWLNTKKFFKALRRVVRNMVWGDQVFVQFQGPTTIILQSRNPVALVEETDSLDIQPVEDGQKPSQTSAGRTYSGSLKLASVQNGKVVLQDTPSFT